MSWIRSIRGGSVEMPYKLKDAFSKKGFLLLEVILMMLICVLHAVSAGHYVDFFPINGTYQNYNNVIR